MNRYYYISDNLKDLESVQTELKERGIESPQLHLYTRDDMSAEVDSLNLHEVTDFTKRDIIRSGFIGFGIGVVAATLVLALFYFLGWTKFAAGWVPAIFLALIVLGFATWVGGLRGIQEPNHEFTQFKDAINEGKHIFFIDVDPDQEDILKEVTAKHPQLEFAGDGNAAPGWLVHGQANFQKFVKAMP